MVHCVPIRAAQVPLHASIAHLPVPAKKPPVQSSRSNGPLDAFTAATRLKSASTLPPTSPAKRTFRVFGAIWGCPRAWGAVRVARSGGWYAGNACRQLQVT